MFGEIYLCEFPTSGTTSKPRSVLALFDLQSDAVVCRVTSVMRSGAVDITLTDWLAAGLLKPSVARLDRLVTAEKSVLWRRLGVLSDRDKVAVRAAWNQHMKL